MFFFLFFLLFRRGVFLDSSRWCAGGWASVIGGCVGLYELFRMQMQIPTLYSAVLLRNLSPGYLYLHPLDNNIPRVKTSTDMNDDYHNSYCYANNGVHSQLFSLHDRCA